MSQVNDAWVGTASLPKWTSTVIAGLKRLDAADAKDGKTLDGNYLGVDLKSFALLYAFRSNSNSVPTFARVIDATEALRAYSKHPSADALGRAMVEGARAMLEGREPRYATVEGFKSRFIDVDFGIMVKEIAQGKPSIDAHDWKDYWQKWLGGCWPDLFKHRYLCDGSSCFCEFPR